MLNHFDFKIETKSKETMERIRSKLFLRGYKPEVTEGFSGNTWVYYIRFKEDRSNFLILIRLLGKYMDRVDFFGIEEMSFKVVSTNNW